MSISIGGLASGLDTNGMIEQMLAIQQQPITRLQEETSAYEVELTTYGSMQGLLESLQSAVEAMDTEGELASYTATSGDTDLFSVSADDDAVAGDYTVTVQQMAKAHKLTSSAFSEEEAVGEGTIHLKVGTADATDIAISADDTIEDVADAINEADVGVTAAVVFDGTNYFLTLAAEETGEDNVINLTVTEAGTASGDPENSDTTGLSRLVYDQGITTNMSNTQSSADAIITVDGVSNIKRSSNVIDDVLQGVTLTLKSAPDAPDNETTLTVSSNASAVKSKINSFVNAYNKVAIFITEAQKYNADTEVAGILMGDATTNSIRNRLENMVTGVVSGTGDFTHLSDIGITLDSEGQLEVDDDILDAALDDNFDEVLQFFTQSTEGSEGVAVEMQEVLDSILNGTDGAITARTKGIQESIDSIEEQIERMQIRNETWEVRTRAQFNSLELLLAEYQSTGDYLTQQITGMQNLNSYISKG